MKIIEGLVNCIILSYAYHHMQELSVVVCNLFEFGQEGKKKPTWSEIKKEFAYSSKLIGRLT